MKLLSILLISLAAPVWAVELTEDDKEMCTTLSQIGHDIQQYRRLHDTTMEETIHALTPNDNWFSVYFYMAEKIYDQVPKAAPPAAVGIDLNSHCVTEMLERRALELES